MTTTDKEKLEKYHTERKKLVYDRVAIEIAVVTWLLNGVKKHFVREYWEGGKHYLVYERVE